MIGQALATRDTAPQPSAPENIAPEEIAPGGRRLLRGTNAHAGAVRDHPSATDPIVSRMRSEIGRLRRQCSRLLSQRRELEQQVRLAGRLQRDLLPRSLDFACLRIEALYQPLEQVSGDIYDVARLDEQHIGISLADASGHGMPAGLVTALLKRPFRGKQIVGDAYRILTPPEVLQRVNRDMMDHGLSDCGFVAGLHAVYHTPTRALTLARGGLCYPILLRSGQPPRRIQSRGALIGALDAPVFEPVVVYLEPGDRMILYTDGLEALLLDRMQSARRDCITQTAWYARLAQRSLSESLDDIRVKLSTRDRADWPADDVTILALTAR